MKNKRYTIGFLFGDFYGAYTANLFLNIVKACRDYGQNILGFGGGFIKSPNESVLGENCNFIYDLVNKENIDGIILEGSVGNFISKNNMKKFLLKYQDIPIVNIGTNIEGLKNIIIDSKKGMEDLITHLIQCHNYKKIAFVAGTEGNYDANQRLEAYKNVLNRHNIAIDDNLITNGNFSYFGGVQAFKVLFQERKASFDVIVCSNDYMALSIINEMQKNKLKIPKDAAVTGFDDTEECWMTKPTLTTVKQPFYNIGQESVKMLISMLDGKKVPDTIVLPTEFIIRESCGCKTLNQLEYIKRYKSFDSNSYNDNLNFSNENQLIDEISKNIDEELPFLKKKINKKEHIKGLIDSVLIIKEEKSKDQLLNKFLDVFYSFINSNEEVLSIYKFISIFYKNLINYFTENSEREAVLQLWNDTSILFGLLIKNDQSEKKAKFRLESHIVFDINENFINTFNIEKLKEAILNNLLHFQFKNFFVCLFEDKNLKSSRILIAYDKNQKEKIHYNKFPSKYLLPSKIDKNKQFEYVVMALNFKDESFGYIIYDVQTLTSFIYETLSVQISGAIKGAKLTNKLYEYTTQLESKVKERTLELEKAKKNIEEANVKLKNLDSLKNEFIANITHDFRSPLTSILNITDLALNFNNSLDNENKENYNVIYKSSLKLKSSIDKLLELAKMDAQGIKLKIEKVDIVSFINKILDFYTSSVVGSEIKIIRELPSAGVKEFYSDTEKLEQIIDNIISNAVKFVDPHTGIINVKIINKTRSVLIVISDNGIGINREKLQSIFNRFEQAHEGRNSPYRGTGIGLAFAKQLVEYLKGKIWAESEGENKGSKFIIEFKKGKKSFDEKDFIKNKVKQNDWNNKRQIIKTEIEIKLQKGEIQTFFTELNKENEYNYKKAKILIVDDDKSILNIIMKYLKNYGYKNFIIASDGQLGLDAAYDYIPDLIISDYNMPKMKGDYFQEELRNNPYFQNIPFIFLSAIADKNLILERRQKGASAFLKKPIDKDEFKLVVEQNIINYMDFLKTKHLATIDELTGLYNRRAVINELNKELSLRKLMELSVIFCDIDHFKKVNDTYGHQAGDLLLKKTGSIIKQTLRNYDVPSRFGGEEFLIILPDTNMENAKIVAEKLRKNFENNVLEYNNNKINITASFGVSSLIFNENDICKKLKMKNIRDIYELSDNKNIDWSKIENIKKNIADVLIAIADKALYEAKSTVCQECGFKSEKAELFVNNKCPNCQSLKILNGRNKISIFKE